MTMSKFSAAAPTEKLPGALSTQVKPGRQAKRSLNDLRFFET